MDDALGYNHSFTGPAIGVNEDIDIESDHASVQSPSRLSRVEKRESPAREETKASLPQSNLKNIKPSFGDHRIRWSKRQEVEMGKEIMNELIKCPRSTREADMKLKIMEKVQ